MIYEKWLGSETSIVRLLTGKEAVKTNRQYVEAGDRLRTLSGEIVVVGELIAEHRDGFKLFKLERRVF